MIEFRGVTFSYTKRPFLSGLNLEIQRGVVNCLIGPNGCGKSTLLRLAAGLLAPQAGTVLLDGADLRAIRRRALATQVALLRQGYAAPPLLAGDVVLTGRYPHRGHGLSYSGEDHRVAAASMARTGCAHLTGQRMDRLSGGERQRVYLAAALAQDTGVLLLDEPTTYLDIQAALELMELVRAINREGGKTILMVLHDLDLALRFADRIIAMEQGAVRAVGSPAWLLDDGVIPSLYGVAVHRFQREGRDFYAFE